MEISDVFSGERLIEFLLLLEDFGIVIFALFDFISSKNSYNFNNMDSFLLDCCSELVEAMEEAEGLLLVLLLAGFVDEQLISGLEPLGAFLSFSS